MTSKLRWGIVGTGNVARLFAEGLKEARTGALHAVGSRNASTAEDFASEFEIDRYHASYEELVGNPEVDVVYIATPNSLHREHTLLALEAGKPVLCEKPFSLDAAEATEVITAARDKGLFLMEAMWTRFFPIMVRLRDMISEGAIGEIRMIEADFGFRAEIEEEPNLFNLRLGGGALMDVGVYPLSLASMLLGPPSHIAGLASLGASGVDEQCAVVLGYESGQLAVCKSAIRTESPQEATIMGTTGTIRIEAPFWRPKAMTLSREEIPSELIERSYSGNGYHYEADEVGHCIAEGKLESDVMPLAETQQISETLDAIRARWTPLRGADRTA